jgi:hypothetical protein
MAHRYSSHEKIIWAGNAGNRERGASDRLRQEGGNTNNDSCHQRAGNERSSAIKADPSASLDRAWNSFAPGYSSGMRNSIGLFVLGTALVISGCDKKEPAAKAPAQEPSGYLGAAVKAHKSAIKTVETASINKAIEMFEASEGRTPKTLDELVPKYIHEIPAAPHGMKLDYDAKAGIVKVVPE